MAYSKEHYVLHFHSAHKAGDHYDFRLHIPNGNMTASWAIPKAKIPQKKGDRCLAVRGHDHSKIWTKIKSIEIPEGEYGAGKILLLQEGIAIIDGWSDKYITFNIDKKDGKHIFGRFSMIKFKGNKKNDKDNLYILLKLGE